MTAIEAETAIREASTRAIRRHSLETLELPGFRLVRIGYIGDDTFSAKVRHGGMCYECTALELDNPGWAMFDRAKVVDALVGFVLERLAS
jgi:hypothetical protein